MPRKKRSKTLPSGIAVIIGIAFIFLFFSTTTLTISQIKSKNKAHQKKVRNEIQTKMVGLEKAKIEEAKRLERITNEKKGVVISISESELVIESAMKKEDDEKGEMLKYEITEGTLVILHSEIEGKDQQTVGDWESLAVGDTVSVGKETPEKDQSVAKIIRLKS